MFMFANGIAGRLGVKNFGISQSRKLLILMGKLLSIFNKVNVTPNTLGCYGLKNLRRKLNVATVLRGSDFCFSRTRE